MSIESAPYYWVQCDYPECGLKSTEGSDFTAWADEGEAIEQAGYTDWWLGDDGTHFCTKHIPRCPVCVEQLEVEGTCPAGHPVKTLTAIDALLGHLPRPGTPPHDPVEEAAAKALYDHDYRPDPVTPWERLPKDRRRVYRRRARTVRAALKGMP